VNVSAMAILMKLHHFIGTNHNQEYSETSIYDVQKDHSFDPSPVHMRPHETDPLPRHVDVHMRST